MLSFPAGTSTAAHCEAKGTGLLPFFQESKPWRAKMFELMKHFQFFASPVFGLDLHLIQYWICHSSQSKKQFNPKHGLPRSGSTVNLRIILVEILGGKVQYFGQLETRNSV